MTQNRLHIFHLHEDPRLCAQSHCDLHVKEKMVEYAIHLCNAHRIIDGRRFQGRDTMGRVVDRYFMKDPLLNRVLYKTKYANHVSSIWTRRCYENYTWLYDVWVALAEEYTYRFNEIHDVYRKMHYHLLVPPEKIESSGDSVIETPEPIEQYRNNYWINRESATYTRRKVPDWWTERGLIDIQDNVLDPLVPSLD